MVTPLYFEGVFSLRSLADSVLTNENERDRVSWVTFAWLIICLVLGSSIRPIICMRARTVSLELKNQGQVLSLNDCR